MAERWVINASPIILLSKAGVIHWLPILCDELVIPAGVVAEVQRGKTVDEARMWLHKSGSPFIRPAPPISTALASWQGGDGEAEVISWAMQHPDFTAVLDDRKARTFALRQGVNIYGSLRIIVRAKELGFLPEAKPALEKLRGVGAYVSDELIDLAIALAGED